MPTMFGSMAGDILRNSIYKDRETVLTRILNERQYLLDFYHEDQTANTEYLEKWGFEKKTALPLISTNLTARVIDRIAMAYQSAPQRKLVTDEGRELDPDNYAQFFADNEHINPIIKRIERYYKLLGNVLLFIEYSGADAGGYQFHIVTQYIPEFPSWSHTKPVAYHLARYGTTPQSPNEPEGHWLYISPDEYFFHSGRMSERWPVEGLANNPDPFANPYGLVPIVDYSQIIADNYWSLGARSLVDANRMLNVQLMNLFYGMQFQSFDQSYITGMPAHLLQDDPNVNQPSFKTGADESWLLPEGAVAGLLKPDPKLIQGTEYIERWLNIVLSNYGVVANFRESGTPQSGFAIRVKNIELLENRKSDIEDIYRMKEQEIYDIVRALDMIEETAYKLPEDANLQIDFADPEFPLSPQDKWLEREKNASANIETPIDWMMQENPDLTREEAEQRLLDNQAINNVNRSSSVGLFRPFVQEQPQTNGSLIEGIENG